MYNFILIGLEVVLTSKFCNSVTNNHKKNAWEEITLAVNEVNTGDRNTVEQVRLRSSNKHLITIILLSQHFYLPALCQTVLHLSAMVCVKSNFSQTSQSVIKLKTSYSLSFFKILKVKKCWEDITTSVKRKERQARQGETKRLKVTGNGNLPDEEVR